MNADELTQRLRRGETQAVYLLVGEEQLLLEATFRQLKDFSARLDPTGLNVDKIYASDSSAKQVLSLCRTTPMGRVSHRFIFVRAIEKWATKIGNDKDGSRDAFEQLVRYFEAPVPSTVLVLTASKLDGRSKLVGNAKARGWLLSYDKLSTRQLVRWIEQDVARQGCSLESGAAELLVEVMGADLAHVADAVERLVLYVGTGNVIDSRVLGELLIRVSSANPFQVVDAVSRRDTSEILRLLHDVFDPRTGGLPLVGLLAWSVRQLIRMKEGLQAGLAVGEAAKQAGVPPFRAQQVAARTRNFSVKELERWLFCLAHADQELKSSRRPSRATLENLLLSMTA